MSDARPSPELERAFEFGLSTTLDALRGGRTEDAVSDLMARLKESLGVRPSTDPCAPCRVRRPARAVVAELIPITRGLARLPAEVLAPLRARAAEYGRDSLPCRDGRMSELRVSCPFEVDGECVIANARPISCVPDKPDPARARYLEFGLQVGLSGAGLDHHLVELGAAVQPMLDDPGWTARYLRGEPCLRDAATTEAGRDSAIETSKERSAVRRPSGFPVRDVWINRISEIARKTGFREAMAANPRLTPFHQIARVEMPYIYESEEDIDRWRTYYVDTLRQVAGLRLDPVEAFDALRMNSTFPLAYHGRDCKEILSLRGDLLVGPIASAALPDLVRPIESKRTPGRIRVGYLSFHMRGHNGARWALGWIANHSKEIETFVFHTGPSEDEHSVRLRATADHYYHAPGDVPYTARFIRSLELDVMIFPDLGMHGANDQYAALRLARVQCTAWGHPVSSGLQSVDCYLSSQLMEPSGAQDHYREELIRLPGSGLTLERPEPVPLDRSRGDFGLPEGFLVLMPQMLLKMVPRHDGLFARLSEELENPIVFLGSGSPLVDSIFERRMRRAGVRMLLLPRASPSDFHRLLQLADVLVDPPAWSGGNTTLEALIYRKPVVTLPGEFMRGRHGLAFLTQAGMGGLIARDEDEFVRLVMDRHAHATAVANMNPDGPFNDLNAVRALDAWTLKVSGRQPA